MIARARIPNVLTFARLLAIPVALASMLYDPRSTQFLFWLFALAAITDFFDGYLARKWNATSMLGKLLDPMADKLLVALLLIYLIHEGGLPSYAADPSASRLEHAYAFITDSLFVPIVIIILRELYIAGLREFLSSKQIMLPVSAGGKWKTAVQMVAILLLLFGLAYGAVQAWSIGTALLWVAAFLALTSATDYTRKAWSNLP